MTKRSHGDGGMDERGPNKWRLRYRVNGKRVSVAFSGTRTKARTKLRSLLDAVDKGEHVDPSKITVGAWIDTWIKAGAPGRKKKRVSQRTLERYEQLLLTHVEPVLGARPLQKLKAAEIDKLYASMATAADIAPRTQHHVHVVFGALLATAARKGLIVVNPMLRVEQVPNPEERISDDDLAADADDDIGEGLDEAQLASLIAGFKPSSLFPVVALAAASGARRNELLALRWTDLDPDKKRSGSNEHGNRLKSSASGSSRPRRSAGCERSSSTTAPSGSCWQSVSAISGFRPASPTAPRTLTSA